MRVVLLASLLGFASLSVSAAPMYVCTDAAGNKTYTQNPSARCQPIQLGKPSLYSSAAPSNTNYRPEVAPTPTAPTLNETPSAPSVTTLGESDQVVALRRKLEQAKKALSDGRSVRYGNERNYAKYLERIAGLEKAVKDIEAELEKAQGVAGSY